jgi:hypothetical protein
MRKDHAMNTMSPVPAAPSRRNRIRSRWTGLTAALVVLVAIAGAAAFLASRSSSSAGPGVAHVGATPTGTGPSSSQSGSTQNRAAAYSACMRSHGVPSFPDPDAQGHLFLKVTKGGPLDPSAPSFQAAQQACKSLAPSQNTSASNSQFQSQGLQFAACMRSHGVPNFPDPKTANGGFMITGVNPNAPQFQSAMQACRSLMPGGGPAAGQ